MNIGFEPTGKVEALQQLLETTLSDPSTQGLIVLAADANGFTKEGLDPILRECPVPVLGGVFPEIIHGHEHHTCGTILVSLTTEPSVIVFDKVSATDTDFEAALDASGFKVQASNATLVLVDGFSRRISELLEALYNVLGLEASYIGGGAGSLSMVQKPCLLTNRGMLEDAALVANLHLECGVGVSHGWEKVEGPYRVTASDRNVIQELECRPAAEVYRSVVEPASSTELTEANFFDVAKQYPFGIQRYGAETVVRDPLKMTKEGALVCVGEVPQDSSVFILGGQSERLIQAAGVALERAREGFAPADPERTTTVLFDCISRVLFLGEDFDDEINAMLERKGPHFGALTIGEIANSGNEFLEFYNKTSVIGVIDG